MEINTNLIQEGVILYPTVEEFSNFRDYINTIEGRPELQNQGIVKVMLIRLFPLLHLLNKLKT